MPHLSLYSDGPSGLTDEKIYAALDRAILTQKERLHRALLLPPDFTRFHSGAGKITAYLYHALKDTCQVDIMPALGTPAVPTEARVAVKMMVSIWGMVRVTPKQEAMKREQTP